MAKSGDVRVGLTVTVVVDAVASLGDLAGLDDAFAVKRTVRTDHFTRCAASDAAGNRARDARIDRIVVDDGVAVIVLAVADFVCAGVGIRVGVVAVTSEAARADPVEVTVSVKAVPARDTGANIVAAACIYGDTLPRFLFAVRVRFAATATDAFIRT